VMAKIVILSLTALLLSGVCAANAPIDEETCHTSDEWCVGKKRSAETLLQANKMKVSTARLAAHDDGAIAVPSKHSQASLVLPPRRLPRQTLFVSQDKSRQVPSQRTCVPVGIETMQGAPPSQVACGGELQCNKGATVGQNVGAYEGDFEPILDMHTEWPVTVTEIFAPWPEETDGVVIGVMVGHSHAGGTLLGSTIIRRNPSVPYEAPFPPFKITFEATEAGELIVSFPEGPFIGETLTFARAAWLLEFPCKDVVDTTAAPTTTTTTSETDECLANNAKFDFANAKAPQNNLGGQGPNFKQSQGIRYEGLTEQNGKKVDLVVTNTTAYQKGGPNGMPGKKWGAVSVVEGQSVDLLFSFEDSDSGEPVVIDVLHFTFFDFDGSAKSQEEVYVDDISGYVVDDESTVKVDQASDGRIVFKSTSGETPNSPQDILALTDEQQKRTAMLIFQGKSSFKVTLGVPCSGGDKCKAGRGFFFAADSSLSKQCQSEE